MPLIAAKPRQSLLKAALRRIGLDVSYIRSTGFLSLQLRKYKPASDKPLPPLFNDPLEALFYMRGGKQAAFRCPIDQCVTLNGLNFSSQGWHAFSATLAAYAKTGHSEFAGSVLEQFYERWQPASAGEAFIDPDVAPPRFSDLPPHLIYLFPWSSRTIDEVDTAVKKWTADDNIEHRGPRLQDIRTSLKDQGPVSPEVAEFEYRRLLGVYESLKRDGFERRFGDIAVLLLKRGNDYRFLNFGGGLHRTAAMRALGYSHAPARLLHGFILDVDDASWWPQVQNGLWSETHVKRYFDHLFDFDAYGWAKQQGLTAEYAKPPMKAVERTEP